MEKYAPSDSSSGSATTPFLDKESDVAVEEGALRDIPNANDNQSSRRRLQREWAIVHLVLIGINLFLFLSYSSWMTARQSHGPRLIYSPARDVLDFQTKRFELEVIYLSNGSMNPEKPTDFNGEPRPELDAAWQNLLHHQNIRLKKEELGEFANDDSLIQLADGSGYYATFAVFHALHCIKRLHHFIHLDHYYPNISEADARRLRHHTEHCLDSLRQSVQCNADITVFPLHWGAGQRIPIGRDTGKHQCVNWDRLKKWMEERSFNAFEPGLLVHLTLGPAFPDGKGEEIGILKDYNLHVGGHQG